MTGARIRLGLGIGILLGALFLAVLDTRLLPAREHRISVCYMSTTTEDPCDSYAAQHSP